MAGTDAQWLYREGELMLGPLSTQQVVEKLFAGEILGATEIARLEDRRFARLSSFEPFKLPLAKAEAKHRVEAQDRAVRGARAKRRNRLLFLGLLGAVVAAVVIVRLMVHLAVHNPFKASSDELAFADISVEPPTIALASARAGPEEELLEYPVDGVQPPSRADRPERPASRPAGRTAAPRPARMSAAEPDGMQVATFDQGAINRVVSAQQRTLYTCFQEEARRKPGLATRVPIEFVIGNDGRVTQVWVDHPDFKKGTLPDCLLRQLRKWPFKPYEGERATVGLSFNIGRRT